MSCSLYLSDLHLFADTECNYIGLIGLTEVKAQIRDILFIE